MRQAVFTVQLVLSGMHLCSNIAYLSRKLQQDSTAAVTEANRRFYAAFEHCNLQV